MKFKLAKYKYWIAGSVLALAVIITTVLLLKKKSHSDTSDTSGSNNSGHHDHHGPEPDPYIGCGDKPTTYKCITFGEDCQEVMDGLGYKTKEECTNNCKDNPNCPSADKINEEGKIQFQKCKLPGGGDGVWGSDSGYDVDCNCKYPTDSTARPCKQVDGKWIVDKNPSQDTDNAKIIWDKDSPTLCPNHNTCYGNRISKSDMDKLAKNVG